MENALSLGLMLGFTLLPVIATVRWAARPTEVRIPVRARAQGRR